MSPHGPMRASCAALPLLIALTACATPGRRGPPGTPPAAGVKARIAVFPVHDLSADRTPISDVDQAIASALRQRGLIVVDARQLEPFLARHRIRYTGGIDRERALAARTELDVDGVLITVLEQHTTGSPPRLAVSMRLVDVKETPRIAWTDSLGRSGDDAPGLLDLGLVKDMPTLRTMVFDDLARSLEAFLAGKAPRSVGCARARRQRPRVSFLGRKDGAATRRTVAVLPFVNRTARRAVGELVAQHFLRQLHATSTFEVIDPGEIRARLLETRSILAHGVPLTRARLLLTLLRADTVVIGEVFEYDTRRSIPTVDFSVTILDGKRDRVIWRSSSHNRGDDGFHLFELGRTSTAAELGCSMIAAVVDELQVDDSQAQVATPGTPPPSSRGKNP